MTHWNSAFDPDASSSEKAKMVNWTHRLPQTSNPVRAFDASNLYIRKFLATESLYLFLNR